MGATIQMKFKCRAAQRDGIFRRAAFSINHSTEMSDHIRWALKQRPWEIIALFKHIHTDNAGVWEGELLFVASFYLDWMESG